MPAELRRRMQNISPERAESAFVTYMSRLATNFTQDCAALPTQDHGKHATDGAVIFTSGGTRVLYYAPARRYKKSLPCFLVPSLINRSYIMDFSEDGLVRRLTERGHACYLVDFSEPKNEERDFRYEEYVLRRLLPAALHAWRHSGAPAFFLGGYCVGGWMALALAQRLPQKRVAGVALFGVPWNFSRVAPAFHDALQSATDAVAARGADGPVPGAWVAALFYAVYWPSVVRRRDRSQDKERAGRLNAWLNDGIDVSMPLAKQTVCEWLGKNAPENGKWYVGESPASPRGMRFPLFICAGKRDAVVPLSASLPAAKACGNAQLHLYPGGHVGMMTGGKIAERCRRRLNEWMRDVVRPKRERHPPPAPRAGF